MSRLTGTSLHPRKVADMAVTEGVNLKYVDVMRKSLYAADAELERLAAVAERSREALALGHARELAQTTRQDLPGGASYALDELERMAAHAERLRDALEQIAEDAEAWHGTPPELGHLRALALAERARAALTDYADDPFCLYCGAQDGKDGDPRASIREASE